MHPFGPLLRVNHVLLSAKRTICPLHRNVVGRVGGLAGPVASEVTSWRNSEFVKADQVLETEVVLEESQMRASHPVDPGESPSSACLSDTYIRSAQAPVGQNASSSESSESSDGPLAAKLGILLLLSMSYIHQATTGFALPAMLPMISAELGITDVQGALLTSGYSFLYAAALLPIGVLADKVNRSTLLAAGLALWSSLTLVAAETSSFTELLISRVGFASAQAVQNPVCFSIIQELFPKNKSLALSVYNCSIYVARALSFAAVLAASHHTGGDPIPGSGLLDGGGAEFLQSTSCGAHLVATDMGSVSCGAHALMPFFSADLQLVSIAYTSGDMAAVSVSPVLVQYTPHDLVASSSATWREVLQMVAVPGFALSAVVALAVRDPRTAQRQQQEPLQLQQLEEEGEKELASSGSSQPLSTHHESIPRPDRELFTTLIPSPLDPSCPSSLISALSAAPSSAPALTAVATPILASFSATTLPSSHITAPASNNIPPSNNTPSMATSSVITCSSSSSSSSSSPMPSAATMTSTHLSELLASSPPSPTVEAEEASSAAIEREEGAACRLEDEHGSTLQESISSVTSLLGNTPFMTTTVAAALNDVSCYALIAWQSTFYERVYHLEPSVYAPILAMVLPLGGIVGGVGGGWLADKMAQDGNRVWVTAGASLLAAPLLLHSLTAQTYEESFAALLVGFALSEAWRAPAAVMVKTCAPASAGSTASALYLSIRNVIGGLGPLAVALLSQKFGLQAAMMVVPACYVASGGMFLLAEKQFEKAPKNSGTNGTPMPTSDRGRVFPLASHASSLFGSPPPPLDALPASVPIPVQYATTRYESVQYESAQYGDAPGNGAFAFSAPSLPLPQKCENSDI